MKPSIETSKVIEPTAQEVISWLQSEEGKKELQETIRRIDEELYAKERQARTYSAELLNMRMTI